MRIQRRHVSDLKQGDEKETALTVSQKLAAIEADAREAEDELLAVGAGSKRKQPKATRQRKASRRKSTLSPEELASLMNAG